MACAVTFPQPPTGIAELATAREEGGGRVGGVPALEPPVASRSPSSPSPGAGVGLSAGSLAARSLPFGVFPTGPEEIPKTHSEIQEQFS